jgi:hypothetical protein
VLEFYNYKLGDSLEELCNIQSERKINREESMKIFGALFQNFEKTRQGNLELPDKNKELLFKSLESAVVSLSKVDATSAYRLFRLTNEFALLLECKFPPDQLNPQSYLKTHGNMIAIFRDDLKALRKLILKVACQVSAVQYIKVLLLVREEEALVSTTPEDVIKDVCNCVVPNEGADSDAAKKTAQVTP